MMYYLLNILIIQQFSDKYTMYGILNIVQYLYIYIFGIYYDIELKLQIITGKD